MYYSIDVLTKCGHWTSTQIQRVVLQYKFEEISRHDAFISIQNIRQICRWNTEASETLPLFLSAFYYSFGNSRKNILNLFSLSKERKNYLIN